MSTRQHTTLRFGAVLALLTLAALACSSAGTIGNVSHCVENCLYQEGAVNQQLDARFGEAVYWPTLAPTSTPKPPVRNTAGYFRSSYFNGGCLPHDGRSEKEIEAHWLQQLSGKTIGFAKWPYCSPPQMMGGNP